MHGAVLQKHTVTVYMSCKDVLTHCYCTSFLHRKFILQHLSLNNDLISKTNTVTQHFFWGGVGDGGRCWSLPCIMILWVLKNWVQTTLRCKNTGWYSSLILIWKIKSYHSNKESVLTSTGSWVKGFTTMIASSLSSSLLATETTKENYHEWVTMNQTAKHSHLSSGQLTNLQL